MSKKNSGEENEEILVKKMNNTDVGIIILPHRDVAIIKYQA